MSKELRQAFEETANRNITSILDHSNETRVLTKEMENKVLKMTEQIRIQDTVIEELRKQLVAIQMKVYAGGS